VAQSGTGSPGIPLYTPALRRLGRLVQLSISAQFIGATRIKHNVRRGLVNFAHKQTPVSLSVTIDAKMTDDWRYAIHYPRLLVSHTYRPTISRPKNIRKKEFQLIVLPNKVLTARTALYWDDWDRPRQVDATHTDITRSRLVLSLVCPSPLSDLTISSPNHYDCILLIIVLYYCVLFFYY